MQSRPAADSTHCGGAEERNSRRSSVPVNGNGASYGPYWRGGVFADVKCFLE